MQIGVTGLAVWTAAGGADETLTAVREGARTFSEQPPYPSDGLKNARCGRISGLNRENPATALLMRVVTEAMEEAGISGRNTGLIVGTSSGNICGPFERWHAAVVREEPVSAELTAIIGREAPTTSVAAELGFTGPVSTLSVACVSGTAVLTIAEGWLAQGLCERVVVAGLDALSLYVHAGFSGLGALTASLPRPFTDDRDGLLLGEGAAALVLENRPAKVMLVGTGIAADAVHMTAPDREAGGAVRAARSALARGGNPEIVEVSVHGTATRFNDGMEQVALAKLFPGRELPLQLVKRAIGHTMGAAGAIEAALVVRSLEQRPGAMLSMSSAFGGMNAAAVFSTEAERVPEQEVEISVGEPLVFSSSLREAWPDAPLSASRADRYVRAGITAVYLESQRHDLPSDTALVLASRTNCGLTDRVYHRRIVEEGAGRASRRAFAATVPAAPICEASILFGLQGPLLAFVDGAERAVAEAAQLVRSGRASTALALHLEVPRTDGPMVASVVRVTRC